MLYWFLLLWIAFIVGGFYAGRFMATEVMKKGTGVSKILRKYEEEALVADAKEQFYMGIFGLGMLGGGILALLLSFWWKFGLFLAILGGIIGGTWWFLNKQFKKVLPPKE